MTAIPEIINNKIRMDFSEQIERWCIFCHRVVREIIKSGFVHLYDIRKESIRTHVQYNTTHARRHTHTHLLVNKRQILLILPKFKKKNISIYIDLCFNAYDLLQ